MSNDSPHRGRIQAQGPNAEESESWAREEPPTKSEMIARLDTLCGKLTRREREECFEAARRFILTAPKDGVDAGRPKTFRNRKLRGGVRVDIEIATGRACIDDPE
jgi:hypothetical protein